MLQLARHLPPFVLAGVLMLRAPLTLDEQVMHVRVHLMKCVYLRGEYACVDTCALHDDFDCVLVVLLCLRTTMSVSSAKTICRSHYCRAVLLYMCPPNTM